MASCSRADCKIVISSEPTVPLKCGHTFHLGCILDWFVESDECPVCRHVQRDDKLISFKQKVQSELREKYKVAILAYEDELNRLRSSR